MNMVRVPLAAISFPPSSRAIPPSKRAGRVSTPRDRRSAIVGAEDRMEEQVGKGLSHDLPPLRARFQIEVRGPHYTQGLRPGLWSSALRGWMIGDGFVPQSVKGPAVASSAPSPRTAQPDQLGFCLSRQHVLAILVEEYLVGALGVIRQEDDFLSPFSRTASSTPSGRVSPSLRLAAWAAWAASLS